MKSFLKKLFQKSRLYQYKELLVYAKKNNYILTSLQDWYKNDFYPGRNVFILRHDVDHDTVGAYKMYEIEKEIGAKSTFYFRWNTMKYGIMKQIYNHGFEVSLHYETLSRYCKKNKIVNNDELSDKDFEICKTMLLKEIKEFTERYWKIQTICSHGDKRNRIINISNTKIAKLINLQEVGIKFEAYDPAVFSRLDVYISDSSELNNHTWKGKMTPYEAVKQKVNTICLLTHPTHWNYNLVKNLKVYFRQIKEDVFNL